MFSPPQKFQPTQHEGGVNSLVSRAQQGDLEMTEKLMKDNLGLIERVSRNPIYSGDYDQRLATARLGFLMAIKTFDPDHGVKFSTYACNMMRMFLLDETREIVKQNTLIPRQLREKLNKVDKAVAELSFQLGRRPSDEEISNHLGWTQEWLQRVLGHASEAINVDDASYDSDFDAESLYGAKSPDHSLRIESEELRLALNNLTPLQRAIFIRYYLDEDGPTYEEIGKENGISKARVGQIIKKATEIVRYYIQND